MRYCIDPECIGRENPDDATSCLACRTPLLIQGRYVSIKPLRADASALAEVFLVEDLQENSRLKVLKTLISFHPIARDLFEQEQKLLINFKHLGIPRGEAAFSVELSSGKQLPCLVMEYIKGTNLEQWFQQHGALDPDQALPWLKQITEILHFIHQKGYFHRDIKPANIMQRHTGSLALIDFGTAREVDNAASQGGRMTIVGTPTYMAPEQWRGHAVPQSDFYALGMTFIYLLTGLHPDQHGTQWTNAARTIDARFADLLNRLIDPDPNHRPAHTAVLLQEIDQLMQPDLPLEAPADATIDPVQSTRPQTPIEPLPISSVPIASVPISSVPSTSVSGPTAPLPADPQATEPDSPEPETPTPQTTAPKRRKTPLVLASLLALGILGLGGKALWSAIQPLLQPDVCNSQPNNFLSCGEEMLVPQLSSNQPAPSEKADGVAAMQQKNYVKAYEAFEAAWQQQRDPETLIYKNNAWIKAYGINNKPTYTIAVAAPISTPDRDPNLGLQVLRGIAQAQDAAIREQKLNLQVLIADDGNQAKQAVAVANALVKKPGLIAVLGHYASEVTLPTLPIYQDHGLVLVSGTTTATDLSAQSNNPNHVFFRTPNTTKQQSQALIDYLKKQAPNQKFAVFYNQGDNNAFSKSTRDEFVKLLPPQQVIQPDFDLSERLFNETRILETITAKGATAMLICPDGHTNADTFKNALNLIAENKSKLWVVGCNTLHSIDLLKQAGQEASQRFVISVLWNPMRSTDRDFPGKAETLWKGPVSSITASVYDAGQVLITALQQNPTDRQALRAILAYPSFSAQGASGTISFAGSDRKESSTVLEKVVPTCANATQYRFVSVDFTDECYR